MGKEYKDRGMFHKLYKLGTPSKNILLKSAVKVVLATETTALFAKDLVTNRFVGKEFHIKFERRQNKKGKFKTNFKIIRADSPLQKPKGLLHSFFALSNRFEGDITRFNKYKTSALNKLSNKLKNVQTKTYKGYMLKSYAQMGVGAIRLTSGAIRKTTKLSLKTAKKTAMANEVVITKLGNVAMQQAKQSLRNNLNTSDSGKTLLVTATSIRTLNSIRKTLIQHRIQKSKYKSAKLSFKSQKFKIKSSRQKFKTSKSSFKQYEKQQKAKIKKFSNNQNRKAVIKGKIDYQKKVFKVEKKAFKTQKKLKKSVKQIKKANKPQNLAITATLATNKKLVASTYQKMIQVDANNDAMKATNVGVQAAVKAVSDTHKAYKYLRKNPQRADKKQEQLQKKENKLKNQTTKLQKDKKKITKKKQVSNQNLKKQSARAFEEAKKVAKEMIKKAHDFAKFALKGFGVILLPALAIFIALCIIMSAFTSTTGNSTYILATYNAQDRYLSTATETYTKIAYDFNQKVINCGNSSSWKSGLSSFGVDTSSYSTTPTTFKFGRSNKFPDVTVYDFDADKLSAFMCAYNYDFNTDEQENWTWSSDYESLLQSLFNKEYTFQFSYEDLSGWREKTNYTFYGGGGADKSYWTVYSEDISRSTIKIQSVPSEISQFCNDGKLHYNINTLEVLDANNADKRTGYFIQDQRYTVTDISGHTNNPFYQRVNGKYGFYQGVDENGSPIFYERSNWYWQSDNMQIYYLVNPTDTHIWNSSLEDICLINFYQKNEWYENCILYYTVRQNCTFDQAIEYMLTTKDEYGEDRLYIYYILASDGTTNSVVPYGNHQMIRSPLSQSFQTLIDTRKIFNSYGYDIQTWNSKHCSALTNCHKGLDIVANVGTNVYAMFDATVESVDASKHTITLKSTNKLDFWYEQNKERSVQVIYTNINVIVSSGSTVSAGDVIGTVSSYKHCYNDISNSGASSNYLHITIKVYYAESNQWTEIDPRYLIYRDN